MDIPKKMKAAILMGPNHLEVKEVDVPGLGPEDVLIHVESIAVCSTDVSLIDKPLPGQPPYGEFIPGHEYAGTIVAVGETVDEVEVGDRVAVEAHLGCGRCANCRVGNYTACLNYGNRKKGHRANGFTTNGGFAQYVVNHINTVYKIPDHVPFDEAALITNLGCVLYGFETLGGYILGDYVAVIGPGPLGLASVAASRALGSRRTVLFGTRDSRLKVGTEVGADRIVNVKEEDPVEVIMQETNGRGADIVVEASGVEAGLAAAIAGTKRMGKILMLSFSHHPLPADFEELALNNKAIYTVRGESWANVGRAVTLLDRGTVNLKPMVTHDFPLEKIDEAFETFVKRIGGAVKVIVKPNG